MEVDRWRMPALRKAFQDCLLPATSALGFEARLAARGRSAPHARAGVPRLLRARAREVPRHHVRRVLAGARPAGARAQTLSPRAAQSVQQLRTMALADFEKLAVEGGGRAHLNALDRACEARGVTGLGADAPLARLPAAALAPEAAARAARCAAKQAELERLHGELAAAERERAEEAGALEEARHAVKAQVAALAALLASEACEGVELAAQVATSKLPGQKLAEPQLAQA